MGRGSGLGQHRALQLVGDVRLAAVQHRLVDAERAVRGELGGDQQVVRLEGGMRSGRRRNSAAPITRRRPRSGARIARWPAGTPARAPRRAVRAARRGRGGVVREDRTHAAQHLGERAAGPYLAQFGADRPTARARAPAAARGRKPSSGSRSSRDPVGAAQPQHERAGGPLVADGQRVAQIDEDRVGERRHGGPAQPHHDLVEVDAAGDPPGRGTHEPQPVARPAASAWAAGRRALPGTPPAAGAARRGVSAPGWAGMASGAGRGRCASGSAAGGLGVLGRRTGWAFRRSRGCRVRPACVVPGRVRRGRPGRPCAALARRRWRGPRGTQERPAGVRGVPGLGAFVGGGLLRHACRIRPSGAARRACSRSRRNPIPGIRVPGTEFPRGQRLFLCDRRDLPRPCRCCPRTPRSRPAAPR